LIGVGTGRRLILRRARRIVAGRTWLIAGSRSARLITSGVRISLFGGRLRLRISTDRSCRRLGVVVILRWITAATAVGVGIVWRVRAVTAAGCLSSIGRSHRIVA